MSLRTRLALVFVAATLIPLSATVWLTTLLLNQSLRLSPVDQLSQLSSSLEKTGKEYYQQACDQLKADAGAGRLAPVAVPNAADLLSADDADGFALTGEGGGRLLYLVRTQQGVTAWQRPLDVRMRDLSRQIGAARRSINALGIIRRGSFPAWTLLAAGIWMLALVLVWLVATRFSRPIVNLTQALKGLADGNFRIRVPNERTDEIGLATEAFNRTAAQLEQSRDRLVSLTQLASWQVLARKTAHEVKNSLTPIRLTVEEMVARAHNPDRAFLEQAAGIVVDEIESLERRIRAFSEFSSEPPICPEELDVHAIVEERIAFLKSAHPEIRYAVETAANTPSALADQDLVKGILVNLLENAAEAAGEGGQILARVRPIEDRIAIEVHDSGPGLSDLARRSLFQPTISFKKRGMGLGLSIARKSALLTGGDILLIAGELGGAGFRVLLPSGHRQA
ncbi:MAG TPA: HAMP domain-containing sensor histidine kinase [Bryobacteraceae bacterium]|nr:HAMP domain-containing sensor histidine kinase [Bryobacteraceae bacterium]